MAYAELEPFGTGYIANLIGRVCATIANFSLTGTKEKGKKKFWSVSDFIPDLLSPPKKVVEKKQSMEEMKGVLRAIAAKSNQNQSRRTNKRKRKT